MPPLPLLAIVAIVLILAILAMWIEGLALFAPKSAKRLNGTAQAFCLDHCRTDEGQCPLGHLRDECPLWRFVRADLETGIRVDPLRPVGYLENESEADVASTVSQPA